MSVNDEFATFNSSLQTTELVDTLEGEERLTVFAPTEAAFAALSPELKEKLSQPEILEQVLKYHVVVGDINEDDIKRRGVLTMLESNVIEISGEEGKGDEITVKLNNATASTPLAADNALVIPIDQVLIPPTL
ncbi:MAG: fasciclin domain-containing protein [Cyanobacteria bacterium J06623_7]